MKLARCGGNRCNFSAKLKGASVTHSRARVVTLIASWCVGIVSIIDCRAIRQQGACIGRSAVILQRAELRIDLPAPRDQIATKELRMNHSRYFPRIDAQGRITGGDFR